MPYTQPTEYKKPSIPGQLYLSRHDPTIIVAYRVTSEGKIEPYSYAAAETCGYKEEREQTAAEIVRRYNQHALLCNTLADIENSAQNDHEDYQDWVERLKLVARNALTEIEIKEDLFLKPTTPSPNS